MDCSVDPDWAARAKTAILLRKEFTTKITKDTKKNQFFLLFSFVLFVSFVVDQLLQNFLSYPLERIACRCRKHGAVPFQTGHGGITVSVGRIEQEACDVCRKTVIPPCPIWNRARDKKRLKRGGGRQRLDLDQLELAVEADDEGLLALNEALEKLETEDALCAELIKLRFFAGLKQGDAAEALGLPRRTADRYWSFARAWLYDELRRGDED